MLGFASRLTAAPRKAFFFLLGTSGGLPHERHALCKTEPLNEVIPSLLT